MVVQSQSSRKLRLIVQDLTEGIEEMSSFAPKHPREVGRKRVKLRAMEAMRVMVNEELDRRKNEKHEAVVN